MSNIPPCPEIEPTDEELALSPLDFFQLMHRRFGQYGIVKVRVPPRKRPLYQGLKPGVRFRAKIQPLHLLDGKQRESRYAELKKKIELWKSLPRANPAPASDSIDLLGRTFFKSFKSGVLHGQVVAFDGKYFEVQYGTTTADQTPSTTPSSTPVRGRTKKLQRVDSGFSEISGRTHHELEELRIFVENGQSEENARKLQEVLDRDDATENFCAVCAKFVASDATTSCLGECGEICHETCVPSPEMWACSNCERNEFPTLKRLLNFGYELTSTVDLKEFARRSLPPIEGCVETAFLDSLKGKQGVASAIYGSDLDSLQVEAFPDEKEIKRLRRDEAFWKGNLDLRLLPVHPQSLLSILYDSDITINGVSRPWTYVGSPLSAFCWHAEDHWLYSVNYLHSGRAKVWYGCPGERIDDIESFFRAQLPLLYAKHRDLHHHLVTFIHPEEMVNAGIPVYKAEQNEGDLIVTFPRAYHAGFNSGFNIAEAVNVGCADWLRFGLASERRYVQERRPQVLCVEFLIWSLAKSLLSGEGNCSADFTSLPVVVAELKRALALYDGVPGHLEVAPLETAESFGRRSQRRTRTLQPMPSNASAVSDGVAKKADTPYVKCNTCGRLPFFLVGRTSDGSFHCAEHEEASKAEVFFAGASRREMELAVEELSGRLVDYAAWQEQSEDLLFALDKRKGRMAAKDICGGMSKKRRRVEAVRPCLTDEEVDELANLIDRGEREFRLPAHDETLWKLKQL